MNEVTGNIESIEKQIEDFAYLNDPEISIENNGIGSYEFWGAKGFDHGTNYAENNSETFDFRVHIADRSAEEIKEIMEALTSQVFGNKSDEVECRKGNDVHYTVYFKCAELKCEGEYLTFKGSWELE